MPVDAFPDISPIMVPIFAEAHGMAPEEIERLITYPIEASMNGLPGVTQIKSTSAFGMAVIYVYFRDNVDIYFARQLVNERLTSAMNQLPEMHEPPILGPISTGLGQVFIYYLTLEKGTDTEGKDPNTYLREVNDWLVKFQLRTVPGVADILSIGGHVLEHQIQIRADDLLKFGVSLEEVVDAVRSNNKNVGGQFVVIGSEESLVRGIGLLGGLEDIRNIPVKVHDGVPLRVSDLANVVYGNAIRRGVVSLDGEKEVVSGMVLKLFGENTSEVIEQLYEKVPEVQASLPEGVRLVPYYEQAALVSNATNTVKHALLIGAVLVIVVLFVFLGNVRSSLIVALALPLSACCAFIGMRFCGISANLMSLGGIAIAIGMLGDGTIVMVENIYRNLSKKEYGAGERRQLILKASSEVSHPIVFSILIIILVFFPLFTLEGVEGKMFIPTALTIVFALLGSMLIALMVAPVLCSLLLRDGKAKPPWLVEILRNFYSPALACAIRFKKRMLLGMLVLLILTIGVLFTLGTEFMPTLEEGSVLIGVTMAPSISLEKATETIMKMEREIMKFPEVKTTISRIGRPEAGSHPHPVNYAEVHLELKPLRTWGRFDNRQELVSALRQRLSNWPGVQTNFTQPIQNAFDELLSGIKAQLAVKVFGEDLETLKVKAEEIAKSMEGIPGVVDLAVEQSFGQPQIQIIPDRQICSRYGIPIGQIQDLVELAVGGEVIDTLYLQTRRYGIHMRLSEEYRKDPEAIGSLLVATGESGPVVPLSQLAAIKRVVGPIQINREHNQRRWSVQCNVRGRDLGGVVASIQREIRKNVDLPPGYHIEYGGQFENQQRAMHRLSLIVPTVLLGIFALLWASFGSARHAVIILVGVPLALIGGVVGLILWGEYLSVPASVGFIALFGIAVQNGTILVSYFNNLREKGTPLEEAVTQGALLRLRPVLMTAITTVFGLLPLLFSSGTGSEVQRPLAVVVVFGLTTSTLLTLFVIPTLYLWTESRSKPRFREHA